MTRTVQTVTIQHVLTDTNLLQAWYKVRANQGCAGIDRETIADFESGLISSLALLRDEVLYRTYRPRPLFRIHVPKKKSPGLRSLSIPTVRDRTLQTAAALVLTPLFEAEFEECSYAYRKGRSVNMAVQRVQRLRDQGYVWVVDADIQSFFDEINHEKLLQEVKKLVSDPAILRLITLWLAADVVEENIRFRLKKGVPQGSPISPLLANLYLDRLDEAMLDNDLRMVRFADDFLILCRHKQDADKALEFTAEALETLRLKLHPEKTRVVDFRRGFRFLGVEFVRSLILKAAWPEALPLDLDLNRLAHVPITLPEEAAAGSGQKSDPAGQSTADSALSQRARVIKWPRPHTEMALAFAEAGIDPADFPAQNPGRMQAALPGEMGTDQNGSAQKIPPESVEQVMPLEPPVSPAKPGCTDLDPRLRTLYVLRHGYVLGKESERFTIKKKGIILQRIPAIKVDQIMIFGNAQITTQAMHFCLQAKIPIYLLSGSGRFHGVVDGFSTDPVLLHRDQFRRAEEPGFCLELARECIRGKIANSRIILLRHGRKRGLKSLLQAADRLHTVLVKLKTVADLDSLRGHEGTAARLYFTALAAAFDPDWQFNGRTRQPPTDPVNALLSYGYTLLFYNIYSFIRARGLNPHLGFLHQIRTGHPALVSDMIEEFRAIIVDIVVMNLVFNRRLQPEQFIRKTSTGKACLMNREARKLFIRELEKKMNAPIKHPVSGLRLDYRRCLEHQVHHLAAVIQGREPRYRAMVIR